jgi:hypothetical protein
MLRTVKTSNPTERNPKTNYAERTVIRIIYLLPTLCAARFNVHKFYVLPTQCVCVFCMDLRTNSDYWHLYVLVGLISVWPWDLAHRFSRATPYRNVIPGPLTATDTYIVYNVKHFEYSRNVNHHTRCVITCVGADCGRSRGSKIKTHKWFGTFIIKDGRYTFLFSLYSFNWLVFITETECVYCAVRTEIFYIAEDKIQGPFSGKPEKLY